MADVDLVPAVVGDVAQINVRRAHLCGRDVRGVHGDVAALTTYSPVLCYHRIGGPLELGVTRTGRSVFARQMESLARAGWRTLSLAEFAKARASHLSPLTFLLTFDDGYASLAEHAYPILADLGFTATTFLITDYVGKTNDWDVRYTWNRLEHLTWQQIEHWRSRGFDFASHGATHRRLTWLADEKIMVAAAAVFWAATRASPSRPLRREADQMLCSLLIAGVVPHLCKYLVDRERPNRADGV